MIAYWFAKLADALDEEQAAHADVADRDGDDHNRARMYRTVAMTLGAIVRALRKVGGQ